MQKIKSFMILVLLMVGIGIGYYSWQSSRGDTRLKIQNFNFDQEAQVIDQLFHKGDNWYWMISNDSSATYSMDFLLRHATSSQHEKRHDMIFKKVLFDGKIAGFLSYYPKSKHVWQLLFLIVDQDFRKQGIAKKILKFAVSDMVARGALRVDLATRNNNFRAQSLYKNFGFKLTSSDDEFVHLSWYK